MVIKVCVTIIYVCTNENINFKCLELYTCLQRLLIGRLYSVFMYKYRVISGMFGMCYAHDLFWQSTIRTAGPIGWVLSRVQKVTFLEDIKTSASEIDVNSSLSYILAIPLKY